MKTREDAEKIINDLVDHRSKTWNRNGGSVQTLCADIKIEILDALYPKPESERLKQLRRSLAFYRWKQGQTHDPARIDLILELIDAEIKREKVKS